MSCPNCTCNLCRPIVMYTVSVNNHDSFDTTGTTLEAIEVLLGGPHYGATFLRDLACAIKLMPPKSSPPPYERTPVRLWHRRRACRVYVNWHTVSLPRGRVQRWRSLKEKRQAWGFA